MKNIFCYKYYYTVKQYGYQNISIQYTAVIYSGNKSLLYKFWYLNGLKSLKKSIRLG